jgi:hypothetical protein
MAAQAQYRVDIGKFNGKGGSLPAKAFLRNVDAAIDASGMTPARMAGVVRQALEGDAKAWFDNEADQAAAGLNSWTTLRPLLEAQFCGPLTVAELAVLERDLDHKPNEKVNAFYVKCQRFHLEQDVDVAPDVRADDIYKAQFQRKVKFTFLKGLRPDVRQAMAGVNVQTATVAELLQAARNAEVLVMKSHPPAAAGGEGRKQAEIDALQANLSPDCRAMLAVMQHNFRARGGARGGGGRGRGGGRGGGSSGGSASDGQARQGGQRRPGPSQETLRARQRELCNVCQQWVKHRPAECFKNSSVTDGYGRGGGGGGRGAAPRGGGGRSYSNAAGASGDPGQEFAVYEYEDPSLNG